MRRSWRLVKRRFWPVLGTALLGGLMASLAVELVAVLPDALAALASPHVRAVIDAVVGTFSEAFQWALVTMLATLLYFDQRIRQEGLDLEVMAGARPLTRACSRARSPGGVFPSRPAARRRCAPPSRRSWPSASSTPARAWCSGSSTGSMPTFTFPPSSCPASTAVRGKATWSWRCSWAPWWRPSSPPPGAGSSGGWRTPPPPPEWS